MVLLCSYYAHAWLHEKSCWCFGDLIRSCSKSSNSNKLHLLLHKQLAMLDHLSLTYYHYCLLLYWKLSIFKHDKLSENWYIEMHHASFRIFSPMLAMQFPYIPVMNILVIWALIQLVLPPRHSDGMGGWRDEVGKLSSRQIERKKTGWTARVLL